MPQFILNDTPATKSYDDLSAFAKGYVEAMFFTNEGVDSEEKGENYLNELGVSRLTKQAVANIAKDCAKFWADNEEDLKAAMTLEPGSEGFKYGREELDETRLGHLFLYSRQGHGVGFDDDGEAECLKRLQEAGRRFPTAYPDTYRGWIYHR